MEPDQLPRPKVILLDVYETLLDMAEVKRKVNDLLDSKRGYMVWFELCMQYCFVENSTDQFNDFPAIAKATLQMAGKMFDQDIKDYEANDILEILKHLPVHDEVQRGLSLLNDQQYRIAALTNSSEKIVGERMQRTGLISYFEEVLSAETVQKYKPAPEAYLYAIKKLQVKPEEILLVSAHSWDIAGAANAKIQTAYIKQGKQIPFPLVPQPGYTAKSLTDLAGQLEEKYRDQQ